MNFLFGIGAVIAATALGRKRSGDLGTIPPPPGPGQFKYWLKKTYAPGTPVRFRNDHKIDYWCWTAEDLANDSEPTIDRRTFPRGTRMFVVEPSGGSCDEGISLEWEESNDLLITSDKDYCQMCVPHEDAHRLLEPLLDNWGPLVIPSPRRKRP